MHCCVCRAFFKTSLTQPLFTSPFVRKQYASLNRAKMRGPHFSIFSLTAFCLHSSRKQQAASSGGKCSSSFLPSSITAASASITSTRPTTRYFLVSHCPIDLSGLGVLLYQLSLGSSSRIQLQPSSSYPPDSPSINHNTARQQAQ